MRRGSTWRDERRRSMWGAGPITDAEIRELRALLFEGPTDSRQLHGLVDTHDALGRAHRRRGARERCAVVLAALRQCKKETTP